MQDVVVKDDIDLVVKTNRNSFSIVFLENPKENFLGFFFLICKFIQNY